MRVSGSRASEYLAQTFDGQDGREGDSYGVGGKMEGNCKFRFGDESRSLVCGNSK